MDTNTTYCLEHDWRNLRGLIKTKIGKESEFAKRIGRSKGYVSAVFNNKASFDSRDIDNAIVCCEIATDMVGHYFFVFRVPKSEQE